MTNHLKKIIYCFIFLGMSFGLSGFVMADNSEIDDLNKEINIRKDRIKELESTISKYKDNITQKQTEERSLKDRISIIENRIAQAESSIELVKEQVEQSKLEITSLGIQIDQKESDIEREKNMISKLVRDLYVNDQKNFVEIMLTNSNLADFYNQSKYLESVYTDLGRLVKQVRLSKEDLDRKKEQAEQEKKQYDNYLVELDNKKQDLASEVGTKKNLLAETRSSEARYQTLLSSLREQYKVTENEVESYEAQVRRKLEAGRFNYSSDSGQAGISWPVTGRYITAQFHDPDYPFLNVFQHSGVDIRVPHGSPVYAAASGYIGRAKRCTLASCYSYVLIIHNNNLSTLYGHLSKISVDQDQYINKGDLIGYSGGTPGTVGAGPFVTGAHLHFEVRANGIPVNPVAYLP